MLLFFCNFLQLLTINELKRSSHRKVQFKLLLTHGDVDINVSAYISRRSTLQKKSLIKKRLHLWVLLVGPCTVRPTLFLNFLLHVEQTERYEIDIFFD